MGDLQPGERLSLGGPASQTGRYAEVTGLKIELAPRVAGGTTGTLGTPANADGLFTVYNFQVQGYHTYFAAPKADKPFVWVHNANYGPKDFTPELSLSKGASRKKLQRRLETSGDDRAHHIIPLEARSHELVQRAARGGFDINGANNGIGLHNSIHSGGHGKYNSAVAHGLDRLLERNPNVSDIGAARMVQQYADRLRPGLQRLKKPLK